MSTKHKRTPKLFTLLAALLIAITSLFQLYLSNDSLPEHLVGLESATIERVVDGDTVIIDTGERVRLILINAPESVHSTASKNTDLGIEASNYVKNLLTNKKVYLEKDVSDTDRYNRLLRYLWLPDGTLVNELIVAQGYAQLATFPPDLKYLDRIREAEKKARNEKKGLWK
jgi:micrococcal nuclease